MPRFLFFLALACGSASKDFFNCWDEGLLSNYDWCCGCGNYNTGRTAGSDRSCWKGRLSFEACCGFYDSAADVPALPCFSDEGRPKRSVEVTIDGRSFLLPQLVKAPYMKDGESQVMPKVLFPSGYILARWVSYLSGPQHGLVAGSHFLEIACGLGLPSLVAAALGAARVVATDVSEHAVAHTALGAVQNLKVHEHRVFETQVLDVTNMTAVAKLGRFDTIMFGGLDYAFLNGHMFFALVEMLHLVCVPGCQVLLTFGGKEPPHNETYPPGFCSVHAQPNTWQSFLRFRMAFTSVNLFTCEALGLTHPGAGIACAQLFGLKSWDAFVQSLESLKRSSENVQSAFRTWGSSLNSS